MCFLEDSIGANGGTWDILHSICRTFFNGYEFIYIYFRNTYYMYNTCNIKPGISPKEMKIYVYTKTYTQMFIADL